MLPSFTLQSAMNVATIATLMATRPFRFEPPASPESPATFVRSLDRLGHVVSELAHGDRCYRGRQIPPVLRPSIILPLSVIIFMTSLTARGDPAARFRAAARMAEPMH